VETNRKRMFHTIALAAALTVAGCAGPPKDHPTLQQMKVEHKGRQVYVYTDAQGCQCLYAGDENAYRRLIDQPRQQKIDERSEWAQNQSNQSTYYYKGDPVNWGHVTILTGSDVDLEDLRGGD
jgi:hypothetical protein